MDHKQEQPAAGSSASSDTQQDNITHNGATFRHDPAAAEAAARKLENHERIDESHPLWDELAPADTFVGDTYWADLPAGAQLSFIMKQNNQEAARELRTIGRMFKRDPLSPFSAYFSKYVLTGFGLFTEGYTLFSISNLNALFVLVWPACYSKYTVCNKNWVAAQAYLQIIGIMVGQVGVGIEGDWVGRKFGLVQDALIMTLGLVMLTAMWGLTLNGWVICYAWSLFIYGIGVGGEYPMTSTTALEYNARGGDSAVNQRDDRMHRGRNVTLSFLMQGWGQLFNQGVLIVLLLIFNGGSKAPYSEKTTQWTMRLSFAIMAVMTLWLAYYRYYKLNFTSASLIRSKKKAKVNVSGYDKQSLKLVFTHFGGRLTATAVGWFANDFAFYGNKLFQSSFINVIEPTASKEGVMTTWLWSLVNIAVALCGYYLSAILIDNKLFGRARIQNIGFFFQFILYLLPAILYKTLLEAKHIHAFQAIYFLSTFFQQFGPNCTTFLVAAEVFPLAVRATAHGFSAASGKLGALIPAVVYNYVTANQKFWIVCWFSLIGLFVTVVFLPDTTGLDMRELERYWSLVRQGRAGDYHGIAVHPRHLSLWERVVLKRHLAYDADLDRMDKLAELRQEYIDNKDMYDSNGVLLNEHQEDSGGLMTNKATAYFAGVTELQNKTY